MSIKFDPFLNDLTQALPRLGPYTLDRRIAVGGMAEIYRGRKMGPKGFQKTVAVKRIIPTLQNGATYQLLFIREAQMAARLNHPNIVQVYDFGEDQNCLYLAMEYVPGINLEKMLNKLLRLGAKIPVHLAAFIVREVLSALSYAHQQKDSQGNLAPIIHRDISPANVMITPEGKVKLLDFGIAKNSGPHANSTVPGLFKGKIHYASPEQLRAEPVDARSDLFSTGVLLYILLTGRFPFEGATFDEMLKSHLRSDYPDITRYNSQATSKLVRIVQGALQADRMKRYASAAEFGKFLDHYLFPKTQEELNNELAKYVHDLVRAVRTGGRSLPTPPPVQTTEPETKIRLLIEGVTKRPKIVCAVLVVLGMSAYMVFHRSKPLPFIGPPAPAHTITIGKAFVAKPQPSVKPVSGEYGFLNIMPDGPYATVFVNGKKIGDTPIRNFKLKSGKHSLRFENDLWGAKSKMKVSIEAGRKVTLRRIWKNAPN